MKIQTLNVETKLAIDWHLLEAIENEAESLDTNVDRIVNDAVESWVLENIPDYFDMANCAIRQAEKVAVIEDRAPEYPKWFQGAAAEKRLGELRALGNRWNVEAG